MLSLGFNYTQMHDSSACIVRDGELLFAVAEERLSRVKHDAGFPHRAIRACLDFAGVRADQLDNICVGWARPHSGFVTDLKCMALGIQPVTFRKCHHDRARVCQLGAPTRRLPAIHSAFWPDAARMLFVDHHLAHAISAYAYSGFRRCRGGGGGRPGRLGGQLDLARTRRPRWSTSCT